MMKRRAFIKLAGFAAGFGTGVVVTPIPWQLLDDVAIWTQNWSWIPANPKGENTFTYTTSKLCPSACGLKVRLLEGKPLRTLSSPEHPLGGGLSALAAAETQLLHSPARVQRPLMRTPDGAHVQISWQEAENMLREKISAAGKDLLCLSGDETGSSVAVLSAFLTAVGSNKMFLMPSEAQCASVAWQIARPGRTSNSQMGFDLERASFLLTIGANAMETWGTFIRNRKVVTQKREEGGFDFVHAGPVQNQSAAMADGWVPIKPGSEAVFTLALASHIVHKHGRRVSASNFSTVERNLARFAPAAVASGLGLKAAVIEQLADRLVEADSPLVLCGSEIGQGGGVAPHLAGILLNLLLRGPMTSVPVHTAGISGAKSRTTIYRNDFMKVFASTGGRIDAKVALFYEANPAYGLPGSKSVARAIEKIPFKVSFSAFFDETARLCDLVLPMPLGLERLDDIESPFGCGKVFYGLSRPLSAPQTDSRHGLDVLLALAGPLGLRLPADYETVIKAKAGEMNLGWRELNQGRSFERSVPASEAAEFSFENYEKMLFEAVDTLQAEHLVTLAPISRNYMGTAQTGIPPFNTKLIRAGELRGKEMFVLMNSATAYSLDVDPDDKVKVVAGQNELYARVGIFEGIAPDTVGVCLGFGHTALDEFSKNKGGNAFELFSPTEEPGFGLMVWNKTGVTITKA